MEPKREPGARSSAVLGAFVLALVFVPVAARVEAGETTFHPGCHTEPGSLARVSVLEAARLRESLGVTGIARLLGSPDWRELLTTVWMHGDGLLERLDRAWREWSGQSLVDVLCLFQGAIVVDLDAPALPSIVPPNGARTVRSGLPWTLSIELRGARREILDVASGVARRVEERTGLESAARAVAGTDVVAWSHPRAPFQHAVVGAYLVVSSSGARIEAAARAYAASDGDGDGGKDVDCRAAEADPVASTSWTALPRVTVERPEVQSWIRLQPLLEWLLGEFTAAERRDVRAIVKASGIDALETLSFALGRLDGGVETAWSVTSRGGGRGLVEVIQRGCGRLANVSGALALVPDEATWIHGMKLRPGSFLRGLDRYVRRSVPELGAPLDAVYRDLETLTGVSVPEDLFELGSISTYAFGITPPASRSVRDPIVLVRTEELRPCWRVLEKIVSRRGLAWRVVSPRSPGDDPDALVRYVYMSLNQTSVEDTQPLSTLPAVSCLSILPVLLPAVARLDRPDGWTALSTVPPALVRYRDFYSRGAMLAGRPESAALVLATLEGSSAAVVLRGAQAPAYATAELLGRLRPLAPLLDRAGIDLASLPSAATFLRPDEPARARLEWSASGFTVRTRRLIPSAVVAALAATTAFSR